MHTETLIIGAGLSGLSLATQLAASGRAFHLVEARDRVGGRILTEGNASSYFDMGPAWFWPGQTRIAAMADQLGLPVFTQHAVGAQCYEDETGRVQRGQGFASMAGSYRVEGGLSAFTNTLADRLPTGAVTLSEEVTQINQTAPGLEVKTHSGLTFSADQVVLAMPPRIAATLAFAPKLPRPAVEAMRAIPTWMAGQAKAVAVYERPFWRDAGLSGDAMSRRGPLVEIHDASTHAQDHHALFGFIGVPPEARQDEARLHAQIRAQLARIFGPNAENPISLYIKDWASDPLTATALDRKPLYAHPSYAMPQALRGLWDDRLLFAGTEVAPQFGGYLEGALEAADNAFAALNRVPAV